MHLNATQKLVRAHAGGQVPAAGHEIELRIDQTLTQDATGTLVMLEFEAMDVARVQTELSVQYVDHNLLQTDARNADDHVFLRSACRKFGLWFSRPGNGVSHPLHMEHFGRPGKTLLGADSHTCAAGSLGMLAIGAGGLEVATALAGRPFPMTMPKVLGVRLSGRLGPWVSAKDVILEMLRRHSVSGGLGTIVEYYGPGLDSLSAMDRHVIANMGAELGATTTVFPSDDAVREFLHARGRDRDWTGLAADPGADYDLHDEIDLAGVEPLIACPVSPDNVVPVADVAGRPIQQAYLGSSANPGARDLAVPALMLTGRQVHPDVSLDVNPTSRGIVEDLIAEGALIELVRSGARLHQNGCNGCIGMGQAPGTERISVRTVPRNFPGRSGTDGDEVYLASPETVAACALTGAITDPRTLGMRYPQRGARRRATVDYGWFAAPSERDAGIELTRGPNIRPLPPFHPLVESVAGRVLLKVGDDVSTDDILPAGSRVLPVRSNIPEISKYLFQAIAADFHDQARAGGGASFVVAGRNYGQGSSREHAALAPRYLGVAAVLAKSFARIHHRNLVNFGVLPLELAAPEDYDAIDENDEIELPDVRRRLRRGDGLVCVNRTRDASIGLRHRLSERQVSIVLDGGLINSLKRRV